MLAWSPRRPEAGRNADKTAIYAESGLLGNRSSVASLLESNRILILNPTRLKAYT